MIFRFGFLRLVCKHWFFFLLCFVSFLFEKDSNLHLSATPCWGFIRQINLSFLFFFFFKYSYLQQPESKTWRTKSLGLDFFQSRLSPIEVLQQTAELHKTEVHRHPDSFRNVAVSWQSYAGEDVRLIAVSIEYFLSCSTRILLSALPSNIWLIRPFLRMRSHKTNLFLMETTEMQSISECFVIRLPFHYKFDQGNANQC